MPGMMPGMMGRVMPGGFNMQALFGHHLAAQMQNMRGAMPNLAGMVLPVDPNTKSSRELYVPVQ
jgi:hypothetical protein